MTRKSDKYQIEHGKGVGLMLIIYIHSPSGPI